MTTHIRLSSAMQERLRCPVCRGKLLQKGQELICEEAGCASRFPIVDGIPVLINERNSIFRIEDFMGKYHRERGQARAGFVEWLQKAWPDVGQNIGTSEHYEQFAELLLSRASRPRVLVVGGRILGQGMKELIKVPSLEVVESDVSYGPRTQLICDAHDIPFEDCSFDGVVIQAVLEHVADPYRCVEEIWRVLGDRGLVYAETPFMQQVHAKEYDFTRFTDLGHRRLFRRFEEVRRGMVAGPGTSLAWAWQYFLMGCFTSKGTRRLAWYFSRLTGFWLKYFDHLTMGKPGALDGACGLFFLGRKSDRVMSDREIVADFRGAR